MDHDSLAQPLREEKCVEQFGNLPEALILFKKKCGCVAVRGQRNMLTIWGKPHQWERKPHLASRSARSHKRVPEHARIVMM